MLRGRHSNAFYRTSANVNVKKSMKYFGLVWRRACLFLVFAVQYVIRSNIKKRKNYSSKNRFSDQVRYIILSRKNIRKINLHIYYIFLSILRLKLQSALEVLLRSNSYVEDTKLVSCFIFRIFPFNLGQTFRYLWNKYELMYIYRIYLLYFLFIYLFSYYLFNIYILFNL